jgi:hypothetical protein
VLELELLLPLGEVAELPLDGGVVVVVSVDFDVELLEVVSEERGVVVVPGDADGLVRFGTVPTRSVSVRLHATVMPPASARAQRPDSNFFIADDPPLWGVFRPGLQAATPMPVVRCEPASLTACKRRFAA